MTRLVMSLAAALTLTAQVNTLSPKEAGDGWLLLFDGESTWGWTPEGGAKWKVGNGAIASDGGAYGWLRTNTQFGDFVLKAEFLTAADGNSGIFLRSAKGANPHKTGYELQIYDGHPKFPTGGIVEHVPPQKKSKIKPGAWQAYEITALGPKIVVKLDGKKVLEFSDTKSAMGYVGLQFNPNKPIQFRNVKLLPLGMTPIFNGRNLSGWRTVDPPKPPPSPAEWSVKKGMLNVVKGGGQLETDTQFADFILQMDIRTNTTDPAFHPNSGIFLRGKPNAYWTGYEIQIRNEFTGNDPTRPVDTGSGGVYFLQPARRVVSSDNEFYTQTVIAQGRHISTWVNGYPVADWEDPHPEGDVGPRNKQALLRSGPISLQAHDPKTNLDFKNIRIKNLGN